MRRILVLLLLAGTARADCDDLDLPSLAQAIQTEVSGLDPSAVFPIGKKKISATAYVKQTLVPLAKLALAGDRKALCAALDQQFRSISVGPLLMTAYNTPTAKGSLTADATYKYPLYRKPPGLEKGKPFDTTAQILGGSLAGKGLELVWLADPYDALALQIEGAGHIVLPDGSTLAVNADGQNGQPYKNVGKLMRDAGKKPKSPPPPDYLALAGSPDAREYFHEHPEDLVPTWGQNPHFVFFKVAEAEGSVGPLVAGRSVAVDPKLIPMGAAILITAAKPVLDASGRPAGMQTFTRIVFGQDTGAAIKGARMDIYYGDDAYAQIASSSAVVTGNAAILVGR